MAGLPHYTCSDTLQNSQQIFIIPARLETLGHPAPLPGCPTQERYRHPPDHRQVGPCVLRPDATAILSKDHIEDPVQPVLDIPMAPQPAAEVGGRPVVA